MPFGAVSIPDPCSGTWTSTPAKLGDLSLTIPADNTEVAAVWLNRILTPTNLPGFNGL